MLNKVIDFKILCNSRTSGLEAIVKNALEDGWTPSGSIFVYKDEVNQVVVKFETTVK